jgi:glycosidase
MGIKWLKNAVIYQIMVDRFSPGNSKRDKFLANRSFRGWMGGNIKGIINHIANIKELANILYISPIFATSEYHGYSVTNFLRIDRILGRGMI